jgi:hypothetical protein
MEDLSSKNVTCDSDRQLLLVTDNDEQRLTATDLFLTLRLYSRSLPFDIFLGYLYSYPDRHALDSRLVWCC